MSMTKDELIAFEAEVAEAFNAGRIRAPVHLSGGNEDWLIQYFAEQWRPGDWTCSTWRSHYHALLAGVPRETLMADILAGRSITLCYPKHRFITSAIAGGILPIALGLAKGVKLDGGKERVHCFVGDMVARMGAFHEAQDYLLGHDLPLNLIIEDNDKSVLTNTKEVWEPDWAPTPSHEYQYTLPWPHSGAGRRVEF